MNMVKPKDVLEFWLAAGREKWWKKNRNFDSQIKKLFGDTHSKAAAGLLNDWTTSAEGTLALIIVLDQFSRNLFRNDGRAYAQDAQCVAIAKKAIQEKQDLEMPPPLNQFCYLPLMHSENLEDQEQCLEAMENLGLKPNIKSALEHREIIQRFGRFPHRNAVLGRDTKPEEQAFLDEGGFSG